MPKRALKILLVDDNEDVDRALDLGARYYLSKPIGFDRLCQMARQFIRNWATPRPPTRLSA